MLLGGDELGRTQRGNNNAYCQDNAISWYDWTPSQQARDLTAFIARAVALQLDHPALRRRKFLDGVTGDRELPDIGWYDRDGAPMTQARWLDPGTRFLAFLLAGDRVDGLDSSGVPRSDADILVALNAGTDEARFTVPGRPGTAYRIALDTTSEDGSGSGEPTATGDVLAVPPRSVVVAVATPANTPSGPVVSSSP
jgi:isoamylase